MTLIKTETTVAVAAAKAGMSEKTARKYRRSGRPPKHSPEPRAYRTRSDPFGEVWPYVESLLTADPDLEATTIFDALCEASPDLFQASQLRTLQRRVKAWRAIHGPTREVMFTQTHLPGRQAQSDFTHLTELGVTIAGQPFAHMLFHFTLTYSNWEWGSICFSESFEALSDGLQEALWRLGGVPEQHRTDSLSAAVTQLQDRAEFTARYKALLDHYGMTASHTSPGHPNENGDVEQSHHRIKSAIRQQLRLRRGVDFESRKAYEAFLCDLFERRNKRRSVRVREDVARLRALPSRRLEAHTSQTVKVSRNSTVCVRNNFYSVPSQLIGERVEARIHMEYIEIWYGATFIERMARLHGRGNSTVQYRHIIHSLVRKPGAFAHYRYQQSLFPRLIFRIVYDWLREHTATADRQYLELLELAATTSEDAVAEVLRDHIERGLAIASPAIATLVKAMMSDFVPTPPQVDIERVCLTLYDGLLGYGHEEVHP